MKGRRFGNRYVLRVDKGEKIVKSLKSFFKDNNIKCATITGIGALSKVKVGYYKVCTKQYYERKFLGIYEMTSLVGNITTLNNELCAHLHINFSDSEYNTYGGHLGEAIVGGTCEIFIDVIEGELNKKYDNNIGLNIMDI